MHYIGVRDGKEKKNGEKAKSILALWFSCTQYTSTLCRCMQSLKTLVLIVAEKSVANNFTGKKNVQIKGMISMILSFDSMSHFKILGRIVGRKNSLHTDTHSYRKDKNYTPPIYFVCQGPVVQSIISLTSSLVVKMLTLLVSTISNSQVFLLKN